MGAALFIRKVQLKVKNKIGLESRLAVGRPEVAGGLPPFLGAGATQSATLDLQHTKRDLNHIIMDKTIQCNTIKLERKAFANDIK